MNLFLSSGIKIRKDRAVSGKGSIGLKKRYNKDRKKI
jgi:hypothetical protein